MLSLPSIYAKYMITLWEIHTGTKSCPVDMHVLWLAIFEVFVYYMYMPIYVYVLCNQFKHQCEVGMTKSMVLDAIILFQSCIIKKYGSTS